MRFFVFVLSIALIVSTTYAHAIVWLPAVSGAVIRTAAGHYMKVASKKALVGSLFVAGGYGTNFAVNYCKKNQKKCKDIIGDTLGDYFFGDDDNEQCKIIAYYKGGNQYRTSLSKAISDGLEYKFADSNYHYERTTHNAEAKQKELFAYIKDNKDNLKRSTSYQNEYLYRMGSEDNVMLTSKDNSDFKMSNNLYIGFYTKLVCDEDLEHKEQRENEQNEELAKKIAEHLSDDDIDQIINNYSKEIEINIDKYCATAGACAELEQSFGDEVMNNKNKYDIDKINKDNCEVRDGKITSCDKAKKDTDDDDSDTPKDTDTKPKDDGDDNDSSSKDKDDKPINCDSSLFHKKVCDFIDWYQSDDYEKTDNKINIQDDTPKPTNTNIEFTGSCPASYVVSHTLHFGMLGSYDFEFTLLDTPKLCNFLNDWIKPIMMLLGPLHAIYIIGSRND